MPQREFAFLSHPLVPALAVAAAGGCWGLFWMPYRYLEAEGLNGVWASISFYVAGLLLLLPFLAMRFRRFLDKGPQLIVVGFFAGAAFGLYTISLLFTEVIRSLLLFYLTPLWSTLIAYVMLRVPITTGRAAALIMGVVGLLVILDVDSGIPLPRNLGDWLSLLGGISWAYGSTRIYSGIETDALENTFSFFACGLLVCLPFLFLPLGDVGTPPSLTTVVELSPWLLLAVGTIFVPPTLVIVWGAERIDPGRVGLLLMTEVVVGTGSAALLSGEPFGWREAIGTILIVGAAFTELTARRKEREPVSRSGT